MKQVIYKAGEIIFRYGDTGELGYSIIAGVVEVFIERDREAVILGRVSSGEFLGEMAILDASGNVAENVQADIVSSAQNNDTGVPEEEKEDKIVIKEKVTKGVFDDLSKIVSFISVDGTVNAQLVQKNSITPFIGLLPRSIF